MKKVLIILPAVTHKHPWKLHVDCVYVCPDLGRFTELQEEASALLPPSGYVRSQGENAGQAVPREHLLPNGHPFSIPSTGAGTCAVLQRA